MKEALKLLLAFAPWFAFWIIAGPSMFRLRLGIITAAVLVVVMAVTKLHRGAILWAGYLFFSFALVSVVWLEDVWVIQHLGALATGTLFLSAQLSILLGRPFTEDYAREHVPQELWNSPAFMKSCYTTTAAWACVFFINFMLNVGKLSCSEVPEWIFSATEYSVIFLGIVFTNVYSGLARRKRREAQGA
jgi:hypothetical protein